MSRPRFLADNDLNDYLITGLLRREPAIDLVRAREVGFREQSDAKILEHAAAQGLIVISHDVNTMIRYARNRLAEEQAMPGLVMVRQTEPIGAVIEDLLLIWSCSNAEEWNGIIQFLPI